MKKVGEKEDTDERNVAAASERGSQWKEGGSHIKDTGGHSKQGFIDGKGKRVADARYKGSQFEKGNNWEVEAIEMEEGRS